MNLFTQSLFKRVIWKQKSCLWFHESSPRASEKKETREKGCSENQQRIKNDRRKAVSVTTRETNITEDT